MKNGHCGDESFQYWHILTINNNWQWEWSFFLNYLSWLSINDDICLMTEQNQTNLPRNFFILFLSFQTSNIPIVFDVIFTHVWDMLSLVALSWMVGTYFGFFFSFLFSQMSTFIESKWKCFAIKVIYYWWIEYQFHGFISFLHFSFRSNVYIVLYDSLAQTIGWVNRMHVGCQSHN